MADLATDYPPPPLKVATVAARKNELLAPEEALIARPWLLGAERELARINEEIRCLESRRNSLLLPVEVYRVALAPHKILPIDLLREIFLWASSAAADLNSIAFGHAADDDGDPDTSPPGPDVRLILCQISSHWRSVALDRHELWSNVRMTLNRPPMLTDDQMHPRLLQVLEVWLSRSGQHSLSLDVEYGAPSIISVLTRYSHRVRSLRIVGPLEPWVSLLPGSMGSLEKLVIHTFNDELPSISAFVGATRLRSFTLSAFHQDLTPLAIPWHQLTDLYLTIGMSQCYRILKLCTALISACLDMSQAEDAFAQPSGQKIVLPRLGKLALHGSSLGSYAVFLDSFALPLLAELTLSRSLGDGVPAFPTLRQLVIQLNGVVDTDPTPWLRACSSAGQVWLRGYTTVNSTLAQIADGSLLPNVVILLLATAEVAPLLAAVRARLSSPHHSTIRVVSLDVHVELDDHEIDVIANLQAAGISLILPRSLEEKSGPEDGAEEDDGLYGSG
ncbi:hypothetical protein DFH09DRAFT_1357383 [Mycena vulgaris]|nr:hypothetical protein DFH09DRAFT_1357383 [Mycena vulgaris]